MLIGTLIKHWIFTEQSTKINCHIKTLGEKTDCM